MVKAFILGTMERYTMVNGKMDLSMGTVYGEVCTMIHILVSGGNQRQRGTGFTHGRTEIVMKVSGSNV